MINDPYFLDLWLPPARHVRQIYEVSFDKQIPTSQL